MDRGAVVVVVISTIAFVLVMVLAVIFGLRHRAKVFAGTGLAEWRATQSTLSRRDRRTLSRANNRGQSVPVDLAPLAVQRGEAVASALARTTKKGSVFRRVWLVAGIVALVGAVGRVVQLAVGDHGPLVWFNLFCQGAAAVIWLSMPALQRRQLRRVRHSVDLNRDVLERAY